MRKTILFSCLLLVAAEFVPLAYSQETAQPTEAAKASQPAAHFYHLEILVEELGADGKATNSRSYTTTVSTNHESAASIRTGSRVPVVSGSFSSGGDSKPVLNTQFQYIDVGVDIDARRTREIGRQLAIDLTANISSMANATDPELHQPVVRQNKWSSVVLIPVGKPTVVFTSDSLDSKGSMRLVCTVTPLP